MQPYVHADHQALFIVGPGIRIHRAHDGSGSPRRTLLGAVEGRRFFFFGRGGEECTTLRAAGIEVDVVNGVSSWLAAASSIGVPLTHRRYSQDVVFITGHGKTPAHNPERATLAKLNLTLVIYMGITLCAEIQAALLAGGKCADTAVAVVQSATDTGQAQLITTLGQLPVALTASGLASPSIIVIGDVVRCAASVGLTKAIAA